MHLLQRRPSRIRESSNASEPPQVDEMLIVLWPETTVVVVALVNSHSLSSKCTEVMHAWASGEGLFSAQTLDLFLLVSRNTVPLHGRGHLAKSIP